MSRPVPVRCTGSRSWHRTAALRDVLVGVAGGGAVEVDPSARPTAPPGEAARRLQRLGRAAAGRPAARRRPARPRRARSGPAGVTCSPARRSWSSGRPAPSAAAPWPRSPAGCRGPDLPDLAARLAERRRCGGAAAGPRRGVDPPTLLRHAGAARSFAPLVRTYATVPYADVDPTVLAGVAYVVMFGMMFGDVGHGLLLAAGRPGAAAGSAAARWPGSRRRWPFVAGAGLRSTLFGVAVRRVLRPDRRRARRCGSPRWTSRSPLLVAGARRGRGAAGRRVRARHRQPAARGRLAAGPLRTVRHRRRRALPRRWGLVAAGLVRRDRAWLVAVGGAVAVVGLVLAFVGPVRRSGGGGAGVAQAVVELFDMVIRLGSNVVSFARLAAFGLTHAALGRLVWAGDRRRCGQRGGARRGRRRGASSWSATPLAFALEALVAAVQALRLEYYELFSRVFAGRGPAVPALARPAGRAGRRRSPMIGGGRR